MRRALSTGYYALFHTLALDAADLLVGGKRAKRSLPAWRQVYRGLMHRRVKDMCSPQNSRIKRVFERFPVEIRGFADTFVSLQRQRHGADYDPLFQGASLTNVRAAIGQAQVAIVRYRTAPRADRVAFCVYVLFDLRPE